MIQTATVNKIDCAFVQEIYEFLQNRKFALDVCTDDAAAAFLLSLKAHSTCLTYEDECAIESTPIKDYTVDCSASAYTPCATVGSVSITPSTSTCTYNTALQNPSNGTGYPYVDLQNNQIFHKGQINLHVTSSCGDYDSSTLVETGTVLIGATPVTSTDYDFAVTASHDLDNVTTLTNSYIKTIRLYRTDSSGALVNTAFDVDVSPTTSPFLSCGSCTTVNPAHLYFGHANYTTALQTTIENAVRVMSGDSANISVVVRTLGTTGYSIVTRTKHNPSGTHFGIKHTDARLVWRFTPLAIDVAQTTISKTWNNAAIYYTTTINDLCSPLVLTMPTRYYGLSVNWTTTDFNKITLNSPYSTQYSILSNPHSVSCSLYSAVATVTPTPASVRWSDADDNTVSVSNSMNALSTGTYTFTATFDDGCTATGTTTF